MTEQETKVNEVMETYMTVLLERMKKPETPLLEINDGIRLITMHFAKIRNAATHTRPSEG